MLPSSMMQLYSWYSHERSERWQLRWKSLVMNRKITLLEIPLFSDPQWNFWLEAFLPWNRQNVATRCVWTVALVIPIGNSTNHFEIFYRHKLDLIVPLISKPNIWIAETLTALPKLQFRFKLFAFHPQRIAFCVHLLSTNPFIIFEHPSLMFDVNR